MTIVNTEIDHPKNISGLIENQFPEFYKSEGPVFIDFVKAYYDWMETKTNRRNVVLNPRTASINVAHGNANIVGRNTLFTTWFSNGDSIAISRPGTYGYTLDECDCYEIFTINVVSNDTFLTLDTGKLPEFAFSNAFVGNVFSNSNPGYYTRRHLETMDIDKTADEFVVYFKEQFLKNIQFNTITDTRTMIKNSLDLYRSKGTPRAVDLLFKVAYGVPATVYYPSTDLFRPSESEWKIPRYLELSLNPNNKTFVNKQITGLASGATAFCEAVVRRTINGNLVDVAYISAIRGEWQTGEVVVDSLGIISKEEAPRLIGSLNGATIINGGTGYSVGDSISAVTNTGLGALVRVAAVTNSSGTTNLALIEGGYGYTANANVFVSNVIVRMTNVTPEVGKSKFFDFREQFFQQKANIVYSSATGTFTTGDDVFTYYANGSVDGTGAILSIAAINSTYGEMTIKITSGNMENTSIYGTGNTVNATVDTYTNTSVTAEVLGEYANLTLQINTIVGTFDRGETITGTLQGNGINQLFGNTVGVDATMIVNGVSWPFLPGDTITGANSGATAYVKSIDMEFGLINVNNTITILANNHAYANTRNVNGEITFVSSGSGANFSISNNLLYTENINVGNTFLTTNTTHYGPIALNAAQFDLPGDPACNLTSNTIENALTWANVEIGKIRLLQNINQGTGYDRIPIVRIVEQFTYPARIYDTKTIAISNLSSSFAVGEVVTQTSNDFRGFVEAANSTQMTIQRMRYYDNNDIVVTSNSTTMLTGVSSGATANVDTITTNSNTDVDIIGIDAEISVVGTVGNGIITELEVIDSGFGYIDGQTLEIGNAFVTALANVATYGTGTGFWRSKESFTSDRSRLQDGEYWQTHSYEVRSSIMIDKYKDMLKKVVHVAGTRFFGNLIMTSTSNVNMTAVSNLVSGSNTITIS